MLKPPHGSRNQTFFCDVLGLLVCLVLLFCLGLLGLLGVLVCLVLEMLKQMLNLGVFEKHEKSTFAKTYAKFRCFWKT